MEKKALLAQFIAGLTGAAISVGAARSQAETPETHSNTCSIPLSLFSPDESSTVQVRFGACWGVNSCKGQSHCASCVGEGECKEGEKQILKLDKRPGHSTCKGLNTCCGEGFLLMPEDQCTSAKELYQMGERTQAGRLTKSPMGLHCKPKTPGMKPFDIPPEEVFIKFVALNSQDVQTVRTHVNKPTLNKKK